MLCGATQDGRVMVERSDKMWSTREGTGKPLQDSCLENPVNSMKRQNDRILKGELPGLVGVKSKDTTKPNCRRRKDLLLASKEDTEVYHKQYCSLKHWTLLLSPVTSTTGYCFCFGSMPSFFLELFLH